MEACGSWRRADVSEDERRPSRRCRQASPAPPDRADITAVISGAVDKSQTQEAADTNTGSQVALREEPSVLNLST